MSGERAQGEKGGKENPIGKGPLEDHFRDFIEKVFEDEVERGLIPREEIHLLEEEDNEVDKDEAAQTQAEDLQIFTSHIAVDDPVMIKHRQRTLSISVGGGQRLR